MAKTQPARKTQRKKPRPDAIAESSSKKTLRTRPVLPVNAQGILDGISEHVIVYEPGMKLVWANHAALDSLNLTLVKAAGRKCHSLWYGKRNICPGCPVRKAFQTGAAQEAEVITPDGRAWFVRAYPAASALGKVEQVIEIALDVTDHKEYERTLESAFTDIEAQLRRRTSELERTRQRLEHDARRREHAELQLKDSKNIYSTLVENIDDMVFLVDVGGRILFANSFASEHFGNHAGEQPAAKLHQLWSAESAKPVRKALETVRTRRKGIRIDCSSNGCKYELKITPLSDSKKLTGMICVARDITDRLQTEEALKESEEKYRALIENASEGICILQHDRLVYANKSVLRMTGLTSGKIIDRAFADFIHASERETFDRQYLSQLERKKTTHRYETAIATKNGDRLDTEINANQITYGGKPAWLVFLRDITINKKVDAVLSEHVNKLEEIADIRTKELAKANRELRREIAEREKTEQELQELLERRRELERIVNRSPAIVFLWREAKGWPVEFVSENVAQFGFSQEEFYSGARHYSSFIHPDDLASVEKEIAKYSAEPDKRNFSQEYRILTKDGEVRWLDVRTWIRRNNKGAITHYQGIVLDITDRKRAEDELGKSVGKLKKALEGTVSALSGTAERRDPYTAGHQQRVTQLACAIAVEMKLPSDQIEAIRVAGTLHDIGKIYVPAEILNKPGIIAIEEMGLIKTHSQVGYDILKTIEFPWPVADIVLQHHERLDGSGYPLHLAGEEIRLEARILAVADVVEAMASHRPYRPALGVETAMDEIIRYRGVHYDPEIVDICVRLFRLRNFTFSQEQPMQL